MSEGKKKHTLRNIIIVILVLIIICIGVLVVLYTNELLPDGIQTSISKMLGKEEKSEENKTNDDNEKNEVEVEENESEQIYDIIAELDEFEDNDVEIYDVANVDTMLFGSFSKDIISNVSIIKVDDKYGLISNEDGEMIIEPEYDVMYADMDKDYLYVNKGEKKNKINLKTFKVEDYVDVGGHGGSSDEYYDSEKDEIWSQEYEDVTPYIATGVISERYKNIGYNFGIAYELKQGESSLGNDNLRICYYDIATGKVVIKPEYDKGTLFYDGIAGVVKKGKAFFINEDNKKVFEEEFEDCANIHDGMAWIKTDGLWKLVEFDMNLRIDKSSDDNEKNNDKDDENEISVDWKKIYKDYIINGNLKVYETITAGSRTATFHFVDLDSDDIPELMYYDGMEPGPAGNYVYEVYGIKDGKVVDIGEVWGGPFTRVGYNKQKDSYGYETAGASISIDQGVIYLYTEKGLESIEYKVGEDSYKDLETEGYSMKEIELEEYRCDAEVTKEGLEQNVDEAIEAYKTTEELLK